jgi:hypothetical protein
LYSSNPLIAEMIFVSYLTDNSYFPLQRNCRKLLDTVRTGQKWTIWKGVFFIDFQLSYILTRIIPIIVTNLVVIGTDCIGSCKSNYHMITTMTPPNQWKTPPVKWFIFDLFWLCPATFGNFSAEENSCYQLNNWQKSSLQ